MQTNIFAKVILFGKIGLDPQKKKHNFKLFQ